jgi:Fic family protein
MRKLTEAARTMFKEHDPLVQALALHYHFAAMHPFLDGNGRTARALEALMLQRIGLRDTLFIAMSNYYYEEKLAYLRALNESRAGGHDLTPFLKFALKGVESQCKRLFGDTPGGGEGAFPNDGGRSLRSAEVAAQARHVSTSRAGIESAVE